MQGRLLAFVSVLSCGGGFLLQAGTGAVHAIPSHERLLHSQQQEQPQQQEQQQQKKQQRPPQQQPKARMRVPLLFPPRFARPLAFTTALSSTPPPSPLMIKTPPSSSMRMSTGPWHCSGSSNAELVRKLRDSNLLEHEACRKAMLDTDRGFYAPSNAYSDAPQPIGHRQTISAPHMHAHAIEIMWPALEGKTDAKVLDVGCGSGYLTAVLARLVGPGGRVFGVDYLGPLVGMTERNIRNDDASLLTTGRIKLAVGNGWDGWKEEGPFDAIHVGAAAAELPIKLVEQLKLGGRLFIPIGPQGGPQTLYKVDRVRDTGPASDSFEATKLLGVSYVPLVDTGPSPTEVRF